MTAVALMVFHTGPPAHAPVPAARGYQCRRQCLPAAECRQQCLAGPSFALPALTGGRLIWLGMSIFVGFCWLGYRFADRLAA